AIMFRVVDLPHPDGPTRITNSPSAMVRLTSLPARAPSGNRLVTWSRTISAMWPQTLLRLALHRAGGQTGDDAALEQEHDDRDRDRDDDRRGRDRPCRL